MAGLITIRTDPFGDTSSTQAWNGPLIDWLVREYPSGLQTPHVIYLNGVRLRLEDYDYCVGSGDDVCLVMMPAAPVGAYIAANWAGMVASMVVSVGLSLAINALFGSKPSRPRAMASTPAAERVDSLGVPTNAAKIGDPVTVQYGRVRRTPELAAEPYRWYEGNQQYIGVMLSLGHGEFDIHDVLISDTPIGQLASGVGYSWHFPASSHGKVMGNIESVTGIYEDVETSVEVADQEVTVSRYVADVYDATLSYGVSDDLLTLPSAAPESVEVGSNLWLLRPGIYGGEAHTVGAISGDRLTITLGEDATEYVPSAHRNVLTTTAGATTLSVTTSDQVDQLQYWIGRTVRVTQYGLSATNTFNSATAGTDLDGTLTATHDLTSLDGGGTVSGTIDVSSGLDATTTVSDVDISTSLARASLATFTGTLGSAGPWWVDITGISGGTPVDECQQITVELVDTNIVNVAWSAAQGAVGPFAAVGPGRSARIVQIDIELPGGLYVMDDESGSMLSASVHLSIVISAIDDDGNLGATLLSEVESISAATNSPIRKTYSYTIDTPRRVAVSVARTSEPSARAQDQSQTYWTQLRGIRATTPGEVYGETTIVAVRLRATDGISSSAANLISIDATRKLEGVATSCPAAALKDLWTNTVYGAGRSLTELDTDAIDAIESAAVGHNGYNHAITSRRSVWDAMRAIVRPLDYYPVPMGGMISFARDAASDLVVASFTTANMIDPAVRMDWDEQGEHDGYEVEYTDPSSGASAYALYPETSADPESVALEGCTDASVAVDFARGLWLRRKYRRQYLSWTTELEGQLVAIGALVSVTHRLVGTGVRYVIQSVSAKDEHRSELTAWRYDARQYA